jgi:hypothetical protein
MTTTGSLEILAAPTKYAIWAMRPDGELGAISPSPFSNCDVAHLRLDPGHDVVFEPCDGICRDSAVSRKCADAFETPDRRP